MNRFMFKALLVLLSLTGYSYAETSVKVRAAAFLPASSLFREIYGKGMTSYQLEAVTDYNDCYDLWANVDLLNRNGKSNRLRYFTNIKVTSLSAGLSIPYTFCNDWKAYVGLGLSIAHAHIHNRYTSERRNENKYSPGLVVKSGLQYDFGCSLFAELFLDYQYQPTKFRRWVDLGGLKTGLGLGYKF